MEEVPGAWDRRSFTEETIRQARARFATPELRVIGTPLNVDRVQTRELYLTLKGMQKERRTGVGGGPTELTVSIEPMAWKQRVADLFLIALQLVLDEEGGEEPPGTPCVTFSVPTLKPLHYLVCMLASRPGDGGGDVPRASRQGYDLRPRDYHRILDWFQTMSVPRP